MISMISENSIMKQPMEEYNDRFDMRQNIHMNGIGNISSKRYTSNES